jgi:C4-dicarboxylate transporter DctM subunit
VLAFGIAIFAILLASGVPLFMGFALGGLIIIVLSVGLPLHNLAIFSFDYLQNFILLAAPLFILAGQLMADSGLGEALVDLFKAFLGRLPAGLAICVVLVSAFTGALVAQNLAVLASVGVLLFPAMTAAKYEKGFAGGLLCASSQLGFLIPPSVVFIIYGYLTQTSVAELYMAGIIPGVLLAALLCLTALIIFRRRGFTPLPVISWGERKRLFLKAIPAIIMPVIVLGGIYSGIFTPTEAGGVACVYILIVGIFVYRGLNWRTISASVLTSARLTSLILILLVGVMIFGKALNLIGLPRIMGDWVISSGLSPTIFLVFLCIAFVALGIIMDAFAMVVLIPVITPTIAILGIDTIHLGVIFVVASMIGTMTPPAAAALYFTGSLFKIPTADVMRGVWPFLVTTVIALFIFVFFPTLSTWLPDTMLR